MNNSKILYPIALIVLLFGIQSAGQAQDYNTGIGLRGGWGGGLTVKHFVSDNAAFEGILSSRWHGVVITGLYEIHNQVYDVHRLNWYYGFGAHIGFWDGDRVNWTKEDGSHTVIGIDGIIGIEYNFEEVPINIGLDWKPSLNLIGHSGFWGDGGGLSIRFIF